MQKSPQDLQPTGPKIRVNEISADCWDQESDNVIIGQYRTSNSESQQALPSLGTFIKATMLHVILEGDV
ncbi:hypothetical protein EYC84_003538 [Monilinia fructicola]|uniref:Uncharacterized protein n=1 Tax=Monilinia fructicola TaxID=38448 RepID=A0A5M9JTY7_MONFR|nr:hypothetical protein EYC84_003538 [Monilinia fructicola]